MATDDHYPVVPAESATSVSSAIIAAVDKLRAFSRRRHRMSFNWHVSCIFALNEQKRPTHAVFIPA